jgi:heme-degrading monooxygenase HmoA
MILRTWKGIAKADKAENFRQHLKTVTFPAVAKITGFVRGTVTTRTVDDGVEFFVATEWETLDAIRQFAGDEPTLAVVPGAVQEFMFGFDHYAHHYEVLDRYEGTRGIKATLQE